MSILMLGCQPDCTPTYRHPSQRTFGFVYKKTHCGLKMNSPNEGMCFMDVAPCAFTRGLGVARMSLNKANPPSTTFRTHSDLKGASPMHPPPTDPENVIKLTQVQLQIESYRYPPHGKVSVAERYHIWQGLLAVEREVAYCWPSRIITTPTKCKNSWCFAVEPHQIGSV